MEILNRRTKIATLIFCLMPILDPYMILQIGSFDLHIIDVLLLLLFALHIFAKRSFFCNTDLLIVMGAMIGINILSFISPSKNAQLFTSIRVWVFWLIYVFFFSTVADDVNKELFLQYAKRVARISTYFLIVQFIAVAINIPMWDGRLPFLPLGETDGWAKLTDTTGSIRVHAFFQEPSYYGMYTLPVFAYAVKEKDIRTSLLLALGLILSTSSMGIAGVAIILVVWLFLERRKNLKLIHYLIIGLVVAAGVMVFAYVYNRYPQVRFSVEYTINKILNTRRDLGGAYMGTTKIRILGNIDLFNEYTMFKKIVGVGINQYPLVFPNVIPYSNTMVTLLLNGGILMVTVYFLYELNLLLTAERGFNRIFALLFMYVMFTDLCMFTWYAFYLIYWAMLFQKEESIRLIEFRMGQV